MPKYGGITRFYPEIRELQPGFNERRFWARVEKTDACWLWTGARSNDGYGSMTYRDPEGTRHHIRTHRVVWLLAGLGPIPEGGFICHRCDTPLCVRPDHLFLGTQTDNMRDMMSKGRGPTAERNGSARLTSDQVEEIRRRYAEGGITHRQLAEEYGVHAGTISKITLRTRWRLTVHTQPVLAECDSSILYS